MLIWPAFLLVGAELPKPGDLSLNNWATFGSILVAVVLGSFLAAWKAWKFFTDGPLQEKIVQVVWDEKLVQKDLRVHMRSIAGEVVKDHDGHEDSHARQMYKAREETRSEMVDALIPYATSKELTGVASSIRDQIKATEALLMAKLEAMPEKILLKVFERQNHE